MTRKSIWNERALQDTGLLGCWTSSRRHFPRILAYRIYNLLGNQTQLLVKAVAWRQPADSRNLEQKVGKDTGRSRGKIVFNTR